MKLKYNCFLVGYKQLRSLIKDISRRNIILGQGFTNILTSAFTEVLAKMSTLKLELGKFILCFYLKYHTYYYLESTQTPFFTCHFLVSRIVIPFEIFHRN